MMLLWRNAFPRSLKELESEKSRGDAFTWKVSLEARCGAVAAIHAFLLLNGRGQGQGQIDLVTEDTLRRLTVPLEACLNLCSNLGVILKGYPAELKAQAAMLRLRLFEAVSLMPPAALEGSYTQLLRLLVGQSLYFATINKSLENKLGIFVVGNVLFLHDWLFFRLGLRFGGVVRDFGHGARGGLVPFRSEIETMSHFPVSE